MKTKKSRQFFLVLVPHRDIRQELQKYTSSFHKSDLTGLYTFPWVAPLASLSKPLNTDELKHIGRSLREATNWGKINAAKTSFTAFPADTEDIDLFGPSLELNLPELITQRHGGHGRHGGIKTLFSPIVIGAWLIPKAHEQQVRVRTEGTSSCGSWLKIPGFRAAALANMSWRPVQSDNEIMYKWKIGKLCWLPNGKKK